MRLKNYSLNSPKFNLMATQNSTVSKPGANFSLNAALQMNHWLQRYLDQQRR